MSILNSSRICPPACAAALALVFAGPVCADVLEIDATGLVTVRAADSASRAETRRNAAADGVPPHLKPALQTIADKHALSPALLEALVWQESRWQAQAYSIKGAIGFAQLMPDTARELGVDPHDPVANLEGGARYLRQQLDRFGDLPQALAAYNAGPARVAAARGIPAIAETRDFVDSVLGRIARLSQGAKLPQDPFPVQ